jgi:hypothetical protein
MSTDSPQPTQGAPKKKKGKSVGCFLGNLFFCSLFFFCFFFGGPLPHLLFELKTYKWLVRRATGCRCAGELSSGRKKRAVLCNLYSTPVLLPDRRRAGRSGGRRAAIQAHYGLDFCMIGLRNSRARKPNSRQRTPTSNGPDLHLYDGTLCHLFRCAIELLYAIMLYAI